MTGKWVPTDEVAAMLAGWRPRGWSAADTDTLDTAIADVRRWVAATRPATARRTRRMLRYVSGLVLWCLRETGSADVRLVLHPANVDHWVMSANVARPRGWQHSARRDLTTVGRANNPQAWAPAPTPAGRSITPAQPYDRRAEQSFMVSAQITGRANPAARRWLVAATLGGGLSGTEAAAATADDLIDVGNKRIAVRVGGRHPRIVPVRRRYQPLVDQAVATVDTSTDDRFITSSNRNAAYHLAQQLAPSGSAGLVLPRARGDLAPTPPPSRHPPARVTKDQRSGIREHDHCAGIGSSRQPRRARSRP